MANDTQTAVSITTALDATSVQRFLRCYFRLGEPAKSKAGNDKRELTLSFKHGDAWYSISHTLFGMQLGKYLDEAMRLDQSWATFGIGGFRPSENRPDKYGKADVLFFPSDLRDLFGLPVTLPQNNEEEENLHPF